MKVDIGNRSCRFAAGIENCVVFESLCVAEQGYKKCLSYAHGMLTNDVEKSRRQVGGTLGL